jgi:elongation factor P
MIRLTARDQAGKFFPPPVSGDLPNVPFGRPYYHFPGLNSCDSDGIEEPNMRASDIRRGQAVKMDGKLFVVTNADHNTPGNLRAKVQFKLRDVTKGTIMDKRVGATDDIDVVNLDRRQVEYLYSDNDGHVLMDIETFDQTTIPKDVFGDDILYLKPNTQLMAMFYEGKVVTYELPKTVDLKVVDTPPGIKGATATNQLKEAILETGAKTRVPGFIDIGETIRISTETGEYLSRA